MEDSSAMTVYTEVMPTQPIRKAHITPPEPTWTKVEVDVNRIPSQDTKTEEDRPRLDMKPKLRSRSGRLPRRMRRSSSRKVRSLSTGRVDSTVSGLAREALSSMASAMIGIETSCRTVGPSLRSVTKQMTGKQLREDDWEVEFASSRYTCAWRQPSGGACHDTQSFC